MSDMRRAIAEVLRAAATHMIASPESMAAVDRAVTLHDSTVAALTAENAQLRETLTLGLGEQESVIAGLRAENERLKTELSMESYRKDEQIRDKHRILAEYEQLRAALPSSRETTDGRTDPS